MISVLLVDDKPDFLSIAKQLMEKGKKIKVVTAGSADQALERTTKTTYDVIISGYQMRGMNGIELLKKVRSSGSDTPFILYVSPGHEGATIAAMKSGAEFVLEKSIDPSVQFSELVYIVEEIAKRRETERTLRQREKDFHAIVDKNADAMVVLDLNGIVRYVNPAAIALFNLPEKELIGKMMGFPIILMEPVDMYIVRGFKEFVASEMRMVEVEWGGRPSFLISFRDVTGHMQYEEELSKSRDVLEARVKDRTADLSKTNDRLLREIGERKTIEEKLLNEIRERERVEKDLRMEIEQREKTEEALKGAKSLADMYLDLMGHDINNLNQIGIGYLELAMEAASLDEARDLMKKPLEAMKSATQIIQNVRKLQQVTTEESKKEATANVINLCALLYQLQSRYSSTKGREVRISLDAPHLCFVRADGLLIDVFTNLLDNAIKHSNPEKPLSIDINLRQQIEHGVKYYMCMVEDTGPGIPDWVKDKIFQRFKRGVTKAHGKGLGLYLVKRLVEEYHGKVWVEDRVPGDYTKGARFVVMLPAVE